MFNACSPKAPVLAHRHSESSSISRFPAENRSRFLVREREFLWDADSAPDSPAVVLLMLDLPEQQ